MRRFITLLLAGMLSYSAFPQVTTFPHTESWETGLNGWTQGADDDFDWTWHTGSTSTSYTGPSGANHGSHYLYIEASGNLDKTAILYSPIFQPGKITSAKVALNYHVYGSDVGRFELEVSVNAGEWNRLFLKGNSYNGWGGAGWFDLDQYLVGCENTVGHDLQFRVIGVTDDGELGDIAIDKFQIKDIVLDNTSNAVVTENNFPKSQDFEIAGSLGGDWSNEGPTGWTRTSTTSDTPGTGASSAYSGGYYLLFDASSVGATDKTIVSPKYLFQGGDLPVFGFAYKMYGTAVDALRLEMKLDCEPVQTIWTKSGNQGDQWRFQPIDLTTYIPNSGTHVIQLYFTAESNTSSLGDIALDLFDISDTGILPSDVLVDTNSSLWQLHDGEGLYLSNGKVAINTDTIATDHELLVNGSITAEEIRVEVQNVPDYVFDSDYFLRSLEETDHFIKENGHLPDIQPAHVLEKTGINHGEFNMLLLRKIEELTLYMIELKRQNEELEKQIRNN